MNLLEEMVKRLPIRKLELPVKGFSPETKQHVFMTNPSFKEVWERMSLFNTFELMYNIYNVSLATFLFLTRFPEMLFTMNFFGVQEMNYQGFTEYKDKRLSSFSSQLKYVLNPNEYVFFGTPVYSMTEGVVKHVSNIHQDMIYRGTIDGMGLRTSLDEAYGNHIIIEYNGIEYVYGCLMRNSMNKYKIGDKVNAGDQIGRVGCSGKMAKKPYLHVHSRLAIIEKDNLIAKGLRAMDLTAALPLVKFQPFYYVPVINLVRNTPEAIDRMKNQDIKYVYNSGTLLNPGLFIRA